MEALMSDYVFSDEDPIGTIICELNELSSGGDSFCSQFEEALKKVGFTGYWGYLLPPKGDFVDMRSVVDRKIIENMIDYGIYPNQKKP